MDQTFVQNRLLEEGRVDSCVASAGLNVTVYSENLCFFVWTASDKNDDFYHIQNWVF